ncbi:MAG: hypothetical protein PHT59_02835 [Candidatus Omnitrophica bacterium]|nr:hypothetical protein [Candidatus Omnitrophota bacterium]
MGSGRIARAARAYFAKDNSVGGVSFLSRDRDTGSCDLLVGALAGELGERGLVLALKYRKNLIDISDVDPPFYLRNRDRIERAGITVIPGCGFSPGLVNCILGKEFRGNRFVREVEVKAGSLSPRAAYYPFLWCFEDIVLEHRLASWQITNGRKKKFPPFGGFQEEKFFGIDAESYYVASGFENVLEAVRPRKFIVRVVRPRGFREFFRFLESYGLLSSDSLARTKQMLEAKIHDNITFAEVTIKGRGSTVRWLLKAAGRAKEPLNSMQKITASVPAVMGRLLLDGRIRQKGLLFMEELGKDDGVFDALITGVRREGIEISRA